ncbi:retrovirus-related pol polyprotein from transposon TNT 1-94 [Tanacetum coccineum]|uniref:Retrovirus-related pol polyprotein from transposon TNT 1-94 n=1 Tax=Tanacetum coccineum TaxID=301880 RepID=A0ABQ5CQX9_9ASTR
MGTFTRLKCLLNDLENNGVTIPQAEVNATFVNSLPRKWLSMNQTQRANNSIKDDSLATLYGKYIYEEALLANQKRFYKRSGRVRSTKKPIDKTKETCFAYGKTRHFQKDYPSNKTSTPSYPSSNNSFNKFKSYTPPINQTSSHNTGNYQKDYKGKYKGLKAEMAVLTQRIDDLTKGKSEKGKSDNGKSEKGLIDESFEWDKESVSLEDERTTMIRAFMAIAEDEPSVGKADARSGQWIDVTMKKVHKLLPMTDSDDRKHVLDYTHVDLIYVEDQRTNMVNKYNPLKQELSLHKYELSNLKNIVSINCSLQNEFIRVNLENGSLKDEISDLKRVIEKWTCSKVTLYQLLSEQIPSNIVKSFRGKGRRKENNPSKEVLFTKADISTSESAPMITSDSEDDSDIQESLPSLPKLTEEDSSGASKSLISLSDLTANMANLTLNTAFKEIKKSSNKVSQTYVIKKRTESKHPAVQNSCPNKNVVLSTEQLLLTLMEEVKGIKKHILIPSNTSSSVSQACSSKTPKQKVWYGPYKHYGMRNHLSDDCYSKPKCSTCGSISHTTKEHTEQTAVRKSLNKLKGQSTFTPIRTARMSKAFGECKYCGSNKHHPDDYEFYPGCQICGSIAHEIADCPKNLRNSKKQRIAIKQLEPTENRCSRHMTGVKQYLHMYSKEPGPKVVFRDDSSGETKGYGSINCNGITFTMVAYVNGLKYNLISISQLRRDVYIIDMSSFNKESNACFLAKSSLRVNWLWHKRLSHLNFKNINNLTKHNLVSGLPSLTFSKDKNFLAYEKGKHHRASFETNRSFSINKSLHLLHIDLFGPVKPQTINHNKYTRVIVDEYSRYTWVFCLKKKSNAADCIISFIRKMQNLNEVRVKELRSDNGTEFKNHKLEEIYDEKGISQNFSSLCTPEQNGVAEKRNRTLIEAAKTMLNSVKLPKQFLGEAVNTTCYTQNRSIKVKRHGKTAYNVFRGRAPDISYLHMFGCPVHIHNHRDHLGIFNRKADDGFFLGYSLVAKAFTVTEGDEINFNENMSFPDDEFIEPKTKDTQCFVNIEYFPYVFAYENTTFAIHEPDHAKLSDILESAKPQDNVLNRWSREKHIELVNIIGKPLTSITTRSRIRDSDAASAHECLYVNFLSEIEPKKLIEALEEEGGLLQCKRS